MERPYQWIDDKLEMYGDVKPVYALFDDFKVATGSPMKDSSFKRAVRKRFYHKGPVPASSGVRVMEEVEGPNKTVVTESSEIRTLDQLLAYSKVDLSMWKVDK